VGVELLTEVWGWTRAAARDGFEGDPENNVPRDDEAAEIWRTVCGVEPSHIHLGNQEGQLLGNGGNRPLRPLHGDPHRPDAGKTGAHLVNAGSADVIEIWNWCSSSSTGMRIGR